MREKGKGLREKELDRDPGGRIELERIAERFHFKYFLG